MTEVDISVDGQYQYQSETKRQRTAYTRHQALELEKVARPYHGPGLGSVLCRLLARTSAPVH